MSSKASALSNLNQLQRLAIGFAITMLIILFFLHNPLSGYTTTSSISISKALEPCSSDQKSKYREFLTSFYISKDGERERKSAELFSGGVEKTINLRIQDCHLLAPGMYTDSNSNMESVSRDLPIEQWSTVNPLVEFLAPLVNFIYGILVIIFIGAVFAGFVFKQKPRE